jgi:hypothetical protein
MPSWLKNSSLTIAMLALFAASIAGQAFAGWMSENEERSLHHQLPQSLPTYLSSGGFLEAVSENWEGEFLQMAIFVFLSAHAIQKGSAESAKPEEEKNTPEQRKKERIRPDSPWPVRRGGWWKKLYAHSLSLSLALLFLVSFAAHAITGRTAQNEQRQAHGAEPLSISQYFSGPQFWFESMQNWQSEFLSVALLIVLSIYLREKDSPESKPLAAPHSQTGED